MYIIMLGAPGSGKGTIGTEICDEFNLVHVATGDIFREEMKNQTELGKKAEEYISQGKLVPDEVTVGMVKTKLDKLENVLLDGFPRTIDQAKALEEYLKEKNLKDFSGLSYPDEFPSGQNKIGSDIQSAQTVKKLNLDSDDTTVNDGAGSLSAITELLKGLDNLSGELLERAYLMEYMSEMFNCMTTKENDVSLSNDKLNSHYIYNGEIEYLLYGNESTIVNKTEATAVLYSLRLAINSAYVFFDKTLNAEANSIASGISAATGQAWLYPIIKYSYLFCCAVVYSGQDLSSLMKGDEVAVWRANDKVKLNYKEYLKLFLLVSMISENNEKKLLVRTADCIQLNTGKSLSSKYTMLTLRADVKAETTFLPKVPALLGRSNSDEESQKTIKYQGILGY